MMETRERELHTHLVPKRNIRARRARVVGGRVCWCAGARVHEKEVETEERKVTAATAGRERKGIDGETRHTCQETHT